jgi:ubiquinone/menaquinone biosynthesis C-methylase UbiE
VNELLVLDVGSAGPDDATMRALPFYSGGLNAETYDLGVARGGPSGDEDIAFYLALARREGSRVLELGCGTGRVAIALAAAGLEVVGIDSSVGMLDGARAKAASLDAETARRLTLLEGDMRAFSLDRTFDSVLIPARAFAFLLTPEAQMACLTQVHRHLRPEGVLAIDVFDPRLDWCLPEASGSRTDESYDPVSHRRLRVEVLDRRNDVLNQVMTERWRFSEIDSAGTVLRREEEQLALRWTYRYEMRHLLARTGFVEVVEYSDFTGSPPAYGAEQIWVCRRK